MINVTFLAEKVLQSYRKTNFNPCKHRYFDHLTGCCCPLVAIYLNESATSKEEFDYEAFMDYMKRLLGQDEMYIRTMMKGIDELPEKMLGLRDNKEAYRLGCELRKLIFQET